MANSLEKTYLNKANKLDGPNYVNWKFKLQILMECYNVWSIASGEERKPTCTIGEIVMSIQDWEMREKMEKVLLRMFMKDHIIHHIQDYRTSNETLIILKDLYEYNNTNKFIDLKSKLPSIKI